MSNTEIRVKKRDYSLDVLKILATYAVIKLHSGYDGRISSELIHYFCGFAVPTFFMISGALVLNKKQRPTIIYVLQRCGKIAALMAAWALLRSLALLIVKQERSNPIEEFFLSGIQQGHLWHFWYLWSLMILMLLLPILYYLMQGEKKRMGTTMVLMSFCFVMFMLTMICALRGQETPEKRILQPFRMWVSLWYFWLGGILYRFVLSVRSRLRMRWELWMGVLFFTVGAGFVQYIFCNRIILSHSPENMFSNPVIVLWNALLFLSFCLCDFSKCAKGIELLIAPSLGIYIIHPFIYRYFRDSGFFASYEWKMKFLIVAALSTAIAMLMVRIPVVKRLVRM